MRGLVQSNGGHVVRPRTVVTRSSKPALRQGDTISAPPKRVDLCEHRRSVGITLVNNEGLVFAARYVGLRSS